MAETVYNRAKAQIANGAIDLDTDTLKLMLVTSSYVVNPDHDFITASGAGAAELSGTGYTGGFGGAGRKTLTTPAVSEDDANDRAVLDGDDFTWTGINAGTAAGAILIKENTNDADSELIAFFDTNFPVVTNGGDLTVSTPNGLLRFL